MLENLKAEEEEPFLPKAKADLPKVPIDSKNNKKSGKKSGKLN
jgi:hypothetical protein